MSIRCPPNLDSGRASVYTGSGSYTYGVRSGKGLGREIGMKTKATSFFGGYGGFGGIGIAIAVVVVILILIFLGFFLFWGGGFYGPYY